MSVFLKKIYHWKAFNNGTRQEVLEEVGVCLIIHSNLGNMCITVL